jgi:DNA-binding MarR family transcriptional regulator
MAVEQEEPNVLETPDGLKYLAPSREAAWLGLLQAHAELTRALDHALHARHGLSLSAYEVLSRLAHADGGALRMSQLAERTQLSLSRVSRVIDQLQERGVVERRSCDTDSRVVYAALAPEGRSRIAEAQETFFEVIEERFLGKLSCDEVGQLGTIFGRMVAAGPPHPGEASLAPPESCDVESA